MTTVPASHSGFLRDDTITSSASGRPTRDPRTTRSGTSGPSSARRRAAARRAFVSRHARVAVESTRERIKSPHGSPHTEARTRAPPLPHRYSVAQPAGVISRNVNRDKLAIATGIAVVTLSPPGPVAAFSIASLPAEAMAEAWSRNPGMPIAVPARKVRIEEGIADDVTGTYGSTGDQYRAGRTAARKPPNCRRKSAAPRRRDRTWTF